MGPIFAYHTMHRFQHQDFGPATAVERRNRRENTLADYFSITKLHARRRTTLPWQASVAVFFSLSVPATSPRPSLAGKGLIRRAVQPTAPRHLVRILQRTSGWLQAAAPQGSKKVCPRCSLWRGVQGVEILQYQGVAKDPGEPPSPHLTHPSVPWDPSKENI